MKSPRNIALNYFDVVPPEVGTSFRSTGKKPVPEASTRRKPSGAVKISPWALARLNAEDISKAAAQAKLKSNILRPIVRSEALQGHETDSSFGSARTIACPDSVKDSTSSSLAPLRLAARSAFRTRRPVPSNVAAADSPDSSLGSPDLHPFRISSSGAEDSRELVPIAGEKGAQLLRSTSSDGYEASGGEDSDQVPARIVHRSVNWSNMLFNSGRSDAVDDSRASSLARLQARTAS